MNHSESAQRPVIFLAFANDRQDQTRYLRNLPEEARTLRAVLQRAEQAGLCEVVVRQNATVDEILDVFQNLCRNRVAIFHYGGHASSYQLLLETASGRREAANAAAFAAFLAHQPGLQLAFLNGCSTQGQAQALLDAGVAVVVATSQSIDDRAATDFAARFYAALAAGATVGAAFGEAQAAVRMRATGLTRDLGEEPAAGGADNDRLPWDRYVRAGAEAALDWSLPRAANDPLYCLPALPKRDLPASPYRNLDWFRREDAEIFFGRGHEIANLYGRVTNPDASPLILFYGQSGVGKSSVLAAGLLPRLESSHLVRYCRRDQALGLAGTLAASLGAGDTTTAAAAWTSLEAEAGRPLVVVLDQVEEMFTRPNPGQPGEMTTFLQMLDDLFGDPARRPQGRLILGFRKEWLAEIEKRLEEARLPRAKVFLERLNQAGIAEAVEGPARTPRLRDQYGLIVAPALAQQIASDLLDDPESPVAPMLQILLTGMWEAARKANHDQPTFDHALYEDARRRGLSMADFLTRQLADLRNQASVAAGSDLGRAVQTGLVLDVLAYHTTPLGTAEQRAGAELAGAYGAARGLPELVQACQDLYLLVDPSANQPDQPRATRLAHDTLAPHVRRRFDESDAPGQRGRRILESRARDWDEAGQVGTPLDDADLAVVEAGLGGMRQLDATEQKLLAASREARAARKRRSNMLRGVLIGLAGLMLLAGAVATWQWRQADAAKGFAQAESTRAVSQQQRAEAESTRALNAEGTAQAESTRAVGQQQRAEAEATRAIKAEGIAQAESTRAIEAETLARAAAAGEAVAAAEAKAQQAAAEREAQIARARQLAAQAVTSSEQHQSAERSLLLAVESARATLDAALPVVLETDSALRRALDAAPIAVLPQGEAVRRFQFSPDGGRLLTLTEKGSLRLWDAQDGHAVGAALAADPLTTIAFRGDGAQLAVVTSQGVATIWDSQAGQILTSRTITGKLAALSYVKDAPLLAAVGALTDTLEVWNVASGERVQTFEHAAAVGRALFHPPGGLLIAESGNRLHIWNLATGTGKVLTGRERTSFSPLVVSPDGRRLITFSKDLLGYYDAAFKHEGWFQAWELPAGDEVATLPASVVGLNEVVNYTFPLEFSHDGNRVALGEMVSFGGNSSGSSAVWNLADNTILPLGTGVPGRYGFSAKDQYVFFSYGGNMQQASGTSVTRVDGKGGADLNQSADLKQSTVAIAAFSPDDRWLATGGDAIQLRSIGDWATKSYLNQAASELAFNADSTRLAGLAADRRSVWLWDVSPPGDLTLVRHQGAFRVMVPAKTGVVTYSGGKAAQLWDPALTHRRVTLPGPPSNSPEFYVFSPDASVLAVRAAKTVELWDPVGAVRSAVLDFGSDISAMRFSPNGAYLATASFDGGVTVWDVKAASRACVIPKGTRSYVALGAFSPDSEEMAAFGNEVEVWRIADCTRQTSYSHELASKVVYARGAGTPSGGILNTFAYNSAKSWAAGRARFGIAATMVESSPSGALWVTNRDGVFQVWDVIDMKRVSVAYHERASTVLVSPNDKWFVTAGALEQGVRVWQAESGQLRLALTGVTAPLAFSPDSATLATTDGRDLVRLWDVQTGQETTQFNHVGQVSQFATGVHQVSFSADGAWLFTSNKDYTARQWRLPVQDLLGFACAAVSRNLTSDEWDRYLPGQLYRPTCKNLPLHPSVAPGVMKKADELAKSGDVAGALAAYGRAKEIDPTLDIQPEARVAQAIVAYAKQIAAIGDTKQTRDLLKQAVDLDPSLGLDPQAEANRLVAAAVVKRAMVLAKSGEVTEALMRVNSALQIDPNVAITAGEWHTLCRWGALYGQAAEVLDECDKAVSLADAQSAAEHHDSRGIARGLTADFAGAIHDFEFAVAALAGVAHQEAFVASREAWIASLAQGKNPFDEATLKALREQLPR